MFSGLQYLTKLCFIFLSQNLDYKVTGGGCLVRVDYNHGCYTLTIATIYEDTIKIGNTAKGKQLTSHFAHIHSRFLKYTFLTNRLGVHR